MKRITLFLIFSIPYLLFAQAINKKEQRKAKQKAADEKVKKMQKDAEAGAIIFNKQSAFNIALHNDGYSIGFERGKYKNIENTNLWWINLGERRSTKEEKVVAYSASTNAQLGNPFIYGKQNNFYFLKVGFGKQHLLGGKNFSNGVAVQAIYGGGLALGMLKPYYLEVLKRNSNETELIKYSEDDGRFLGTDSIIGSAPFGTGFGEIKLVPGAFAKVAVRFDYGRFNDIVSALEIGINAEFYSQKMPIMALAKEKNFFIMSYVSLIFGSRR